MKHGWLPALVVIALLAGLPAARAKDEDPVKTAENALKGVRLGKPLFAEPLLLIPLLSEEKPEPLAIAADLNAKELRISEPEWPQRRFNVEIENGETTPLLLLGGNFLMGGRLDRLLPRDLLIPAGMALEIETLPAEYARDPKAEAKPLRVGVEHGGATAPSFIRERARFDPFRRLVPIFVSHFLEFRDEGDTRHSLAAIDGSRTLESYCASCQGKTRGFADLEDRKVVGFVSAVHGRLYGFELFGTNDLLRDYFSSIIKAHSYNAAAIELRAKKLKIPIPGGGDEKATTAAVVKQAEQLLAELKAKPRVRKDDLPRGAAGDSVLLRSKNSQGAALTLDGRLVHMVIFPDNPFDRALYSLPIEVPDEPSVDETDIGSLPRREERGTLTESERRLLERVRERRR